MASPVTIKIKLEPYLIRFLQSYFNSKESAVEFPRNHHFNQILDLFLSIPPLGHSPVDQGENMLEIRIPYFEKKNVLSYNYLTPRQEKALADEIWKFFRITFRSEISKYIVIRMERKTALELFMEKYNLQQDCWDMLEKDYQRYIKLGSKRRLFRTIKNLSVEEPVCPVPGTQENAVE